MAEQMMGHDDGLAEDGVRRLWRPPDWTQTPDGQGVEAIVAVLPAVAPNIGDVVDIDGRRYRVLDVRPRRDVPRVLPEPIVHFELDLDVIDDSPHDPLLPRARAIIEAHGGTVERASVSREGSWRKVSIHAEVRWPGRTVEVYGTGESDHRALRELAATLDRLAP
jgi:hypothetical protein